MLMNIRDELKIDQGTFRRAFVLIPSILIASLSLCLAACTNSEGNHLHVKAVGAAEKEMPIKSSYAFPVTKSFTDMNQKITTAVTYNVYVANYDLDSGNFAMTLDKPMASEDQMRVVFSLVGEEGTNENSALKTGTYSAKADKYMKVETVGMVTRKGSADVKSWLDRSTSGDVKITSVSDDTVSGDIDVTAGEASINGSFTAKILKRKQ